MVGGWLGRADAYQERGLALSTEEPKLEALLARAESWAQARVLAAIAAAGEGAEADDLARELKLPLAEISALLEGLIAQRVLQRGRQDVSGSPRYRIALNPSHADAPLLPAEGLGVDSRSPRGSEITSAAGRTPAPRMTEAAPPLDPSPAAEGRDSRQVAADVTVLYRRLFQRQPSLAWLLRQRRRAMELGQDFGQLLAAVQAARPNGNPQAYLEAMLKRIERERGGAG